MIPLASIPPKHPDSEKWYWLEWSEDELQGETISSQAWTVPAGLVEMTTAISGRRCGIKLAGGTLGEWVELEVEIVTTGGETLHERLTIEIDFKGH